MDSSDESDDIDIKDDIEVKDCATDKVYVDSDSGEVEFHSDSDSSVDFEEGATETQMKHLTINEDDDMVEDEMEIQEKLQLDDGIPIMEIKPKKKTPKKKTKLKKKRVPLVTEDDSDKEEPEPRVKLTPKKRKDEDSEPPVQTVYKFNKQTFRDARSKLSLSELPATLPGREVERALIYESVRKVIEQGKNGACLFITGVPGTGKTATVFEIVRALHKETTERTLKNDFQFIQINGMRLIDPKQAYTEIWKGISRSKIAPTLAEKALSKYFHAKKGKAALGPIVLLVDEVDVLVTKNQKVIYNIFDWPSRPGVPLVVLAISNTMNLTEQMKAKVQSRLGMKRVDFAAYNKQQLEVIISSRLTGLSVFDSAAINFCAAKVAAVSGDARRALEICRRSVTIADAEYNLLIDEGKPIAETANVRAKHITAAIQEMLTSTLTLSIHRQALHARIFLAAILLELRQTGLPETSFDDAAKRHFAICNENGISNVPNYSTLSMICNKLGAARLLIVDSMKKDLKRGIMLHVGMDELTFALRSDNDVGAFFDQ